jgi:hypothetical protein
MADHQATWARLREVARQRYPDDDLAAEVAARALFDAEETAVYAADLDAQAEEQGILDTAHAATCLRRELREELQVEGSSACAGDIEKEFVHLDDADLDDHLDIDDLAYLELPTDEEAAESTAEQRALMAPFETQRHDEYARCLMVAKRRAAADKLAASHQSSHQSARRRNLAAVDEARAAENRATVATEQRMQVDRARAVELKRVHEHQYPLPLLLRRR